MSDLQAEAVKRVLTDFIWTEPRSDEGSETSELGLVAEQKRHVTAAEAWELSLLNVVESFVAAADGASSKNRPPDFETPQ